jgi:hypothetical protein
MAYFIFSRGAQAQLGSWRPVASFGGWHSKDIGSSEDKGEPDKTQISNFLFRIRASVHAAIRPPLEESCRGTARIRRQASNSADRRADRRCSYVVS